MNFRLMALVLGGLAHTSETAQAQEISAGVRAGVTFPAGSYGEASAALSTGWNIGAVARIDFGTSRFGVQLDAGVSGNDLEPPSSGVVSDWQAGVALVFLILPMEAPIRPYVLLGGGIDYWQDDNGNGLTPAFYGGAGVDLRLDPLEPYVEVQYRNVFTPGANLRTVQLIFGVRYVLGYR